MTYQSPSAIASGQIKDRAEVVIQGYVDIETACDPNSSQQRAT